ncbi:MAG: hypothetical protein FJ308_24575 [Planctomycetes bacterium]|nr:hypothetical protein [Planctomycetota bacterium]
MEIVALLAPDFETALDERAKSGSAYDARIARLLLDLLDALRHEPIGPRLFASFHLDRDLWLQYRSPNNAHCMITIKMDRPDYGPLVDGLPLFHYRMTCQTTDSTESKVGPILEDRTRSVDSAVEFVRNAIRETRLLP